MRDAHRVNEMYRHDGQHRQSGGYRRGRPRRRPQQEQIKSRHIPQRREAAKIIIESLHAAVGEIKRTGHHDDEAERGRYGVGKQAACGDRIGRHKNVIEDVDHQIKNIA